MGASSTAHRLHRVVGNVVDKIAIKAENVVEKIAGKASSVTTVKDDDKKMPKEVTISTISTTSDSTTSEIELREFT